ncbi:hypothetical protein EV198_0756 [Roseivirga ehrenbergii]|uniref:Uncharacterized protein n=1 Tax=Roseivirga ehrenbergii (strain DSM 102268 / JCM 13514 / KCTC 12282 / NCIMB 14502 / KMM 6017) TaxID=279360 RepID=A0A150X7N0_ROSEK|nr:hypothetical protein [Roseivirga ehrenbergii]KYG74747.1 hypothetical protein MB14_05955 [Roseivirga ehrenbergii]TCL13924.1 hypothetical protein EV198_0756 [Roseivirga ehrenbergii]
MKSKHSIYGLMFLLLLFSNTGCSSQKPDSSVEVISEVFEELIESNLSVIKRAIPPYRPIHPDSINNEALFSNRLEISFDSVETERSQLLEAYEAFDWAKYERDYNDHLQSLELSEADSSLIVVVADSLSNFPERYLSESGKDISTNQDLIRNYSLDSTWRSVLRFENLDKRKPIFFDLKKVKLKFDLVYESKSLGINADSSMSFSKVVFNDAFDRGCFYYTLSCGRLCGKGNLVFVEKVDGRWTIIQTATVWIS